MPTYRYRCFACQEDTEVWESIHSDARQFGDCGHPIIRVIDKVNALHIGTHSEEAINIDAREARWSKDMPAYKRFREKGYQPPGIDGCDYLEATAKSDIWVSSGGKMKYSDETVREGKEQAEDIMKGRV
jgi:hypothetical protein